MKAQIFGYVIASMCIVVAMMAATTDCVAQSEDELLQRELTNRLHKTRRYEAALAEYYRTQLEIRESAVGPEHPDVALELNELAGLYREQGKYAEAEPLYRRALEIREKALGPEHPDVATSLGNLALVYFHQGKNAEAEPLHWRALEIREKALGPEHLSVATSLRNLGLLYRAQGRYSEAEPFFQRALEIREKALGPEHPDVAAAINSLAEIYVSLGRYTEAEPLHRRALEISEKVLGPEHRDFAISLGNLAGLYQKQGKYTEAELHLRRSLEILKKALGSEHPDVATSLGNLALLYHYQGKYAKAEPLYWSAQAIKETVYGPEHPVVALNLNNLAGLYLFQGKYSEAERLYRRALEIREKTLGPEHPHIASNLNARAVLYSSHGRYTEAEPLYRRALEIREKALGPEHTDVAISLNNLAVLHYNQGKYAEAEPFLQRALEIWEKAFGPEHPQVARGLDNLAYLFLEQDRYDLAYEMVVEAASIHENREFSGRNRLLALESKYASVGNVFTNLVSISWKLGQQDGAKIPELNVETFHSAQLSGRSSAAEALNLMAARFGSGDAEVADLARQRQDLENRWWALNKQLIGAIGAPTDKHNDVLITSLRQQLATVEAERVALDARLAEDFPRFAELSNPKPLPLSDVQGYLKTDEALLSYLVAPDETFFWAVTREGIRWQQSDLGMEEIQTRVASLREGLDLRNRSSETGFSVSVAHELYRELVAPVSELISGKSHLLVVPSGPLTSLPFHLLVSEEPEASQTVRLSDYRDAAWLLRQYATTILPSVSSLKALRLDAEKNQAPQPMIGFGDPVFARDESRDAEPLVLSLRNYASYFRGEFGDLDALSRGLPRLPETADELRAVASTLGAGSDAIKLRKAASERTVKGSRLDDYGVVYFATHALVAGETQSFGSRAEPALALSLPDEATEEDDGLLMASEVAQLKLNADWVVLSACNTAAGNEPGAEALSGLARAFFYAGARSLLVSHWPVESKAAVELTTNTFRAMAAQPELGRSQALRQSMLALMNDDSNPYNAHPVIWAPFVVVGE